MVYDSPSTLRWDAHRPVMVYVYKHFAKKSKEKLQNRWKKKRGDKLMEQNTTLDATASTPAAPESAPVAEPPARYADKSFPVIDKSLFKLRP